MNKNFMYGIGAVKYKDFTIGYIEKNSFDLGGKKPEAASFAIRCTHHDGCVLLVYADTCPPVSSLYAA